MNAQTLYVDAELAQASYASLTAGMSAPDFIVQLIKDSVGFSDTQAQRFATEYSVVWQYNDDAPGAGGSGTGLSATVFKDGAGNLTLALRGTTFEVGDLATDASIFANGAGYDQIVAMWNWWQRAAAPAGTDVSQYRLTATPSNQALAVKLDGTLVYLEAAPTAKATGELVEALRADTDHRVDVTGHSLGGHLAMAFNALFPSQSATVTAFNAPGFTSTASNQNFFAALGGSVPLASNAGSSANVVNVIANGTRSADVSFSAIAGLNSRPGQWVNVPIEDQWLTDESLPAGSKNHSQTILTDALAVYSLLGQLQPNLDTTQFNDLMARAAAKESASLERIVDGLEQTLGIDNTPLPNGNAYREALY